ncbi:MAG: TauD/TfdA family dioxygenase [Pseudomonadota bacterium]
MAAIEQKSDRAFGAEVTGIDLKKQLTAQEIRELRVALAEHRALCFPGQTIAPADFLRFARFFGRPHPHVLEHLRLPEQPEILVLTNIVEDESKPNGHNGAAFWHTDNSYERDFASATMLYAKAVPANGGETFICDMQAAYRALPEKRRAELDPLVVRHRYGNRDAGKEHDAGSLQGDQVARVPEVTHRLVQTHPISGARGLYAVAASARGIVGMPDAEARDLLDELKTHCTQPDFVIAQRYRVDDLFIWDTLATMHAAAVMDVAKGADNTRIMHRISVKGFPALPAAA